MTSLRIPAPVIVFLPAFLLFAIGAITSITLPGIYMDAVNPDYHIVLLLNPHPAAIEDWHLPGTMLLGRFPVIGQIYHGALPYYVGLPFYALLGTGVVGIRLTNMIFGLCVLAGAGAFMCAFRVRALIAALCLASLALDPGLLFSFRTQFYITLLPASVLLGSAALTEARRMTPTRPAVAVSGLLAGVACYGYFIYGFVVPAVAVFALCRWARAFGAWRVVLWWLGGFVIGVSPYILGFLLIAIATGGLHGFAAFISGNVESLQVQNAVLSFSGALLFFKNLVRNTILDVGPSIMMTGAVVDVSMPMLKMTVLLALPAAAILTGIARPARVAGLLLLAGMVLGFLVLVFTFGERLWLHHAALLLPVLYAALALALERFVSLAPPRRMIGVEAVVGVLFIPLLIANAADRQAVFLRLEATHGVGLFSDRIDTYAEDSLHDWPEAHRFFPDWGLALPFALLTGGSIPFSDGFSPAAARALLCAGQDAELATVAIAPPPGRLASWIAAVGWGHYETVRYDQESGKPLLDIVRWRAVDRPPGACS